MSSLAQQLQKLAIPQTRTLLGDAKKKKSLLFDPSEAALLDKETFYNLGITFFISLYTKLNSWMFVSNMFYKNKKTCFMCVLIIMNNI